LCFKPRDMAADFPSQDRDEVVPQSERIVLVLQSPSDEHNITRTIHACDAFGVSEVFLVLEQAKFDDPVRNSNPGSDKRLRLQQVFQTSGCNVKLRVFSGTNECIRCLGSLGYYSVAMTPHPPSVDLYSATLVKEDAPWVALWFGQEKCGLTEEAINAAAIRVSIPTVGMVESLNIATSVAVVLSETRRQWKACSSWQRTLEAPVRTSTMVTLPIQFAQAGDVCDTRTQIEDGIRVSSSNRIDKFRAVARQRQRGLVVVLEDPDRLDAGAILRSCDAFGVPEVHFIFEQVRPFDPLANRQVMKSLGSNLWVCSRVFPSVCACAQSLQDRGYISVALVTCNPLLDSCCLSSAKDVFSTRLADHESIALWIGNSTGLSEAAIAETHQSVAIPMASGCSKYILSVPCSVAVALAELARQRRAAMEENPCKWKLSTSEQASIVKWCVAVYAKRHPNTELSNPGQHSAGVSQDSTGMCSKQHGLGPLRAELVKQGW